MENMGGELYCEQNSLILNELLQGKELAKQLQIHLNMSSTSNETREWLAQKILNSYETALAFLGWNDASGESKPPPAIAMSESPPRSLSGSPRSQDWERELKDKENNDGYSKRKCLRRWTKQVQVCAGREFDGPLDDGYSWRKYGQKDILGAKYPRGYYRCSHRNVQNCLATKQVQRSDNDPTIFNITYCGVHSCTQQPMPNQHHPLSSPSISSPKRALIEPTKLDQLQQESLDVPEQFPPEVFLDFKTGLRVLTQEDSFSTFCFSSTSSPSSAMAGCNYYSSPSFINPNYNGNNDRVSYFNGGNSYQNLHGSSKSELTEMISAAASATNSPMLAAALDFDPFGNQVGSDPSFTFDNPCSR